jgi:glycerol-3-phosphate dehydrogenase (NAD(P)+)
MPGGRKLKPRPLEVYHERTRRRGVNSLVYWPARLVIKTAVLVYFRVRRLGREHVPDGGVILASNHRSFLDPFVIGSCVRRPIYFVAKRELFRNPLVGWFLNCMGAFPVRRGQSDEESVRTALELLAHGEAVVVFAEGTRIVSGSLGRPKRGMGRLALQSGAPVVPVAVTGSEHARDGWRIKPVRVHVRCGAPLTFPKIADPSPFLAGEVTERIWPCVELQWEWLGGLPPLRTAAVVDAGPMGTAVASVLARAGLEVQLGCRTGSQAERLRAERSNRGPDKAIEAKTVPEIELAGVDLVVLALPCAGLPDVMGELGLRVGERSAVLVTSRGLVPPLGTTPTAYVSERVHARAVATLAGPANPRAVIEAGAPVTLATRNHDLRRQLGDVLRAGGLTVDATDDVTGTELAACAKSAAALASSAAAPGGSTVADAAAGRILSEIHELTLASGGRSETFAGLAAKGEPEAGAPADSLATVPLLGLAFERQGIEAPVTSGLHRVLAGESSPDQWLETMRSHAPDSASVGE